MTADRTTLIDGLAGLRVLLLERSFTRDWSPAVRDSALRVLDDVRAALDAAPQAEPVAYRWRNKSARNAPWQFSEAMSGAIGQTIEYVPLYAAPPAAAPVQPLSDEQIDEVLDAAHREATARGEWNGGMVGQRWNHIAARAVEAAHGISPAPDTPPKEPT